MDTSINSLRFFFSEHIVGDKDCKDFFRLLSFDKYTNNKRYVFFYPLLLPLPRAREERGRPPACGAHAPSAHALLNKGRQPAATARKALACLRPPPKSQTATTNPKPNQTYQ